MLSQLGAEGRNILKESKKVVRAPEELEKENAEKRKMRVNLTLP